MFGQYLSHNQQRVTGRIVVNEHQGIGDVSSNLNPQKFKYLCVKFLESLKIVHYIRGGDTSSIPECSITTMLPVNIADCEGDTDQRQRGNAVPTTQQARLGYPNFFLFLTSKEA